MYATAAPLKIEGVKRWGATPILMPRDEMLQWMADERWSEEPETFLHPFADPRVMAGHARTCPGAPRGRSGRRARAGSRSAGVASSAASRSALKGLRPEVEVIGVQSDGYTLWTRVSRRRPRAISPTRSPTDHGAPSDASMFELVQECVDRMAPPFPNRACDRPSRACFGAKVVRRRGRRSDLRGARAAGAGPSDRRRRQRGNIDPHLLASLLSSSARHLPHRPGTRLTSATSIQMKSAVPGIAMARLQPVSPRRKAEARGRRDGRAAGG